MAQFSELKDRVQSYLIDVSSDATGQIPAFLRQAQSEIEDRHGFMAMKASIERATVASDGHSFIDLPTGWLRPRDDPFSTDGLGAIRPMGWILERYERNRLYPSTLTVGAPRHLMIGDPNISKLEVYPIPDGLAPGTNDGEYIISCPYWSRLSTLSASSDSNWFSTNADHYLIWRAAAIGLAFNWGDDRAGVFAKMANDEMQKLIRTDKKSNVLRRLDLSPRRGPYDMGRYRGRNAY